MTDRAVLLERQSCRGPTSPVSLQHVAIGVDDVLASARLGGAEHTFGPARGSASFFALANSCSRGGGKIAERHAARIDGIEQRQRRRGSHEERVDRRLLQLRTELRPRREQHVGDARIVVLAEAPRRPRVAPRAARECRSASRASASPRQTCRATSESIAGTRFLTSTFASLAVFSAAASMFATTASIFFSSPAADILARVRCSASSNLATVRG